MAYEIERKLGKSIVVTLRKSVIDPDVLTFNEPCFAKSSPKRAKPFGAICGGVTTIDFPSLRSISYAMEWQ
jgi:hypothetical protein